MRLTEAWTKAKNKKYSGYINEDDISKAFREIYIGITIVFQNQKMI